MAWTDRLTHNHAVLMGLCLAVPAAAAVGVYAFGLDRAYLIWAFVLLCPLMHLLMMRDMHGHKAEDKSGPSKGGGCH